MGETKSKIRESVPSFFPFMRPADGRLASVRSVRQVASVNSARRSAQNLHEARPNLAHRGPGHGA